MTYYFDNEYLKQYLKTGSTLKVFVNKEFLSITDESDLENSTIGIGYNINGKAQKFHYPAVLSVVVDDITFTKEQLNQKLNPEEEAPAAEPKEKEKPSDPGEISIDPDKDKKESIKLSPGDYVINEDPKSIYVNTGGPIESIHESLIKYRTYVNGSYTLVSCLKEHIRKGW